MNWTWPEFLYKTCMSRKSKPNIWRQFLYGDEKNFVYCINCHYILKKMHNHKVHLCSMKCYFMALENNLLEMIEKKKCKNCHNYYSYNDNVVIKDIKYNLDNYCSYSCALSKKEDVIPDL